MAKIQDIRNRTQRTNGTRKLNQIKNIARHHSATTSGDFDAFWRHWHGVKGWGTGGYHEIILRDGTVQLCYSPNEITNGVAGQNTGIYHICLVGNGSFTAAQEEAFKERVTRAMNLFSLPVSAVKGHNEFPNTSTSCPGINMNTVRKSLSSGVSVSGSHEYADSGIVLQYGDANKHVTQYQKDLNTIGIETTVDGSFGNGTKTSTLLLQRRKGLEADGIAGPATQKVLKELLADKAVKVPETTEKEMDEMVQLLPDTQKKDMKQLLTKAYKEKVFTVDHSSKVDKMTRGEATDLMISYVARSK